MTITKPITALAIVLFAQVNVFSYNFLSLKNSEIKLEKDDKKIVKQSPKKQAMARIRDTGKLVVTKISVENSQPSSEILIPRINSSAAFEDAARFAFGKFRLMLFGCCRAVA